MGIYKAIIDGALTMIRLKLGTKRYYVSIGGAMMTCFFLTIMFNHILFKIYFGVHTLILLWMVIKNDEQTNIFDIV